MNEELRSAVHAKYGIDGALFDTIKGHYAKGQGSIEDIARVYHVPVPAVLDITGNSELKAVALQGDLIDPDTASGLKSTFNPGEIVEQVFDLN